jgi:phosphoesterase RecJ-like protein
MPDRDVYQQIVDVLLTRKRVLVTTHVRPDGDALGTTAALVLGLRKVGIGAEVLLLSHLPSKYAFVYRDNDIVFHDVENGWDRVGLGPGSRVSGSGDASSSSSRNPKPETRDPFFDRFDALLVADTGTWSQLPGLREQMESSGFMSRAPKIVLDHHLTQEDCADHKLVITAAAAAGEIAFELLEQFPAEIDAPIAEALFLAIASDTGWFQFANTRPFTHRLAATLIEKGKLDTDRLYQLLYQNERAERVALQARALQSLELLADGRLAVMTIRKDDFTQTGAKVPDTENLINIPLQIRTVEVSLLFTEPLDAGPVRVSLRSKGKVDVAKLAEQFQGGGHARASGLKLQMNLQEAHPRVTEAAKAALAAVP